MYFLKILFGEKIDTASLAKKRLQFILDPEFNAKNAPQLDYLPELQKELIAVISKYVKINPEDIKCNLDRKFDLEILEVKIELPDSR